jgi:hypothetical protein
MSEREKGTMYKPEDFKEILNAFSEKIPALLKSLTDTIYGKDASAKFAQAVASFYKTLKDSGMTDEQAFKLTEEYTSSLNLGGMISKAFSGHREGGD